jgi:hypothetical protein
MSDETFRFCKEGFALSEAFLNRLYPLTECNVGIVGERGGKKRLLGWYLLHICNQYRQLRLLKY